MGTKSDFPLSHLLCDGEQTHRQTQSQLIINNKMDLRVGRVYQLVKKIGSGAFGEIYEGKS